ncbi:GNAT family N-acetyltransferase [Peribacillus sp. SCS-26]|uniref:GNAT family N-acetyltransferase n=1 Tax=Paraperibacillus marinus TaxID=3115295 RepID=UPI00390630B5
MIRTAEVKDIRLIEEFLLEAGLNKDGVREHITDFLLAEAEEGKIAAVIGYESFGKAGLLRSLAFSPAFHPRNLPALLEQVCILAKGKGLAALYLGTSSGSSVPLFQALGFEKILIEQAKKELSAFNHGKYLMGITSCEFFQKRL